MSQTSHCQVCRSWMNSVRRMQPPAPPGAADRPRRPRPEVLALQKAVRGAFTREERAQLHSPLLPVGEQITFFTAMRPRKPPAEEGKWAGSSSFRKSSIGARETDTCQGDAMRGQTPRASPRHFWWPLCNLLFLCFLFLRLVYCASQSL